MKHHVPHGRRSHILIAVALMLVMLGSACGSDAALDSSDSSSPSTETAAPTRESVPAVEPTAVPRVANEPTTEPLATPTEEPTAPLAEPSTQPVQTTQIPAASVVWQVTAQADQGISRLEGPAELTDFEELSDGTLVGAGLTPTGGMIFVWPPDASEPAAVATLEGDALAGMATLDDEWVALAIIDDFDAGVAHVEFRRLDQLDQAVWTEEGFWAIEGQILDLPGPQFALAGRRGEDPLDQEFAIRSIDDPEAIELLERGYQGNLTLLSDGRITTETGAIFDPNEPERDPVRSDVWGVYTISELADGRIATGWIDEWRIYDPEEATMTAFAWAGGAYASPTGLADGRIAVNTERGIEIFAPDALDEPAVILQTPADAGTSEVLGVNLLFTDTHAISANDQLSGSWVWDLSRPDAPAQVFDGGAPFVALADGRVVSNSETGPVIWNPQDLTTGTDDVPKVQGALCSAAQFGDLLWVGTDGGQITAWDLEASGSEPALSIDTVGRIVDFHRGPTGQPVVVKEDGLLVLAEPGSGTGGKAVPFPDGVILSSAVTEDGLIVLGGSGGDVLLVDPALSGPEPVVLFEGSGSSATSVVVLPDGRVSALLIGDSIKILDVDGNEAPVSVDIPNLTTLHVATQGGFLLVPGEGAVTAIDASDPTAPAAELSIASVSYQDVVEMEDGRLATVDQDGIIWVADPTAGVSDPQANFVAVAQVDNRGRFCLSSLDGDRLAVATDRTMQVIEVPADS